VTKGSISGLLEILDISQPIPFKYGFSGVEIILVVYTGEYFIVVVFKKTIVGWTINRQFPLISSWFPIDFKHLGNHLTEMANVPAAKIQMQAYVYII